jgi:putative transposase
VSPFIDEMRERFGVAPICRVLGASERSFYAAKSRPLAHRHLTDAEHLVQIRRVHSDNYKAHGARRVYKQLKREDYHVAKCTVERLMRSHGIKGVIRGKPHFTTHPDDQADRAADLVERAFVAQRPDELWVSDITYGRTAQGFLYVCFVEDVFSRRIVGWQTSENLRAEFVLDAMEMALWSRDVNAGELVAHSDRGSQYTSFAYTDRLHEAGIAPSVGSVGDAYDNAMAESLNGSYKWELVRQRRWKTRSELELATVEWINWYNHTRLHGEIGDVPPAEYEAEWRSKTGEPMLTEPKR